jgi:hypothetical protein
LTLESTVDNFWGVVLPAWLASVGTVGAFVTGGVLLFRELRRDREREDRDQRIRAGLVAAWPVRLLITSGSIDAMESRLKISNGGVVPVYDVAVDYFPVDGKSALRDSLGIVAPGEVIRDLPQELREIWIRAGDGWVLRRGSRDMMSRDPDGEAWRFDTELSFRDASGRRWRRDRKGSLEPRDDGDE